MHLSADGSGEVLLHHRSQSFLGHFSADLLSLSRLQHYKVVDVLSGSGTAEQDGGLGSAPVVEEHIARKQSVADAANLRKYLPDTGLDGAIRFSFENRGSTLGQRS